mmetsp:Transcript_160251/g.282695  ORF Transcript_160251/g.282695 Transcript_160251/m.282695 type:complete len:283 (-) Transcript_160251:194-1042(-)
MTSLIMGSESVDSLRTRCKAPGRYQQVSSLGRAGSALKEQPWSARRTTALNGKKSDPATLPEAGVSSVRTAPLGNHVQSPRGPCRANLYNLDEYVASPRRQLRRGDSCPPLRTDPITHSCCSPRTDPLSMRHLGSDHLTVRQRNHRRVGYTAQSATGKLNLSTHASSMRAQSLERQMKGTTGLNSSSLVCEEDIGPSYGRNETGQDLQPSPRYSRMNDLRELTAINREFKKSSNFQLRESPDFWHCMGRESENRPATAPTIAKEEPKQKAKGLSLFRDPLRA